MKPKQYCLACGASIMEHRHVMSRPLVRALAKLARHPGPVNIKVLRLTRNEWDNFQKLRYWGLVEKAARPDGTRIGGWWQITARGRRFLRGALAIPRAVWTYRGEAVRTERERVDILDIDGQYRTRPEYADDATPHRTDTEYA